MAFQSGKLYVDSSGMTLLDSAGASFSSAHSIGAPYAELQHDSDYGLMGGRTGLFHYIDNPLNTGARNTSTGDKTASTNWQHPYEDEHGFVDGKTLAVGNNLVVVRVGGSVKVYTINGDLVTTIRYDDAPFGPYNDYDFARAVAIGSGRIVVCNPYETGAVNSGYAFLYNLKGDLIKHLSYGSFDNYSDDAYVRYEDPVIPSANPGRRLNGYGVSCAIGEDRIVIGSPYGYKAGAGLATNSASFDGAGSFHIYDLELNHIRVIPNPDPSNSNDPGDHFGMAIAIGDGRIVVGAPNYDGASSKGAIFVFDLDGSFIKKVEAPFSDTTGNFGNAVAVGNGRIVVGNYKSSTAYVYDLNGTFINNDNGVAGKGRGYSVAVSDGKILVSTRLENNLPSGFGRDGNGSVELFDLGLNSLGTLSYPLDSYGGALLSDSDRFGETIAMDNGIIAVSAPGVDTAGSTDAGKVYLYSTTKQPSAIFWNKGFEHHADSI